MRIYDKHFVRKVCEIFENDEGEYAQAILNALKSGSITLGDLLRSYAEHIEIDSNGIEFLLGKAIESGIPDVHLEYARFTEKQLNRKREVMELYRQWKDFSYSVSGSDSLFSWRAPVRRIVSKKDNAVTACEDITLSAANV